MNTPALPHLTHARAPLTEEVMAVDETGQARRVSIPAERALTLYVDKREVVTLMTLGAHPEWLVLGYLCNQRLIAGAQDVHSITVDWDVGAAAVRTRAGIADLAARTARRVVTSGCGQGSVFGDWLADIERLRLGDARLTQAGLYAVLAAIRAQESTYKSAGSVHGCALFDGAGDREGEGDGQAVRMRLFVEDVGRHNAIDTIAGWMALQDAATRRGGDKLFYTTGRLTSEMVLKAAQMGVPIVVSRSGITQMGLALARQLGLCAVGRAVNRHFICYSAPERLVWQPEGGPEG
ncbi:MAG: formate dehydrogenase accessory sulfurtransferase FdhD [Pseudomonadota bacterium]|nr:formate dehydrogenase accessory sulfurtransferase FdhD [Pseudomonadota bacterium]